MLRHPHFSANAALTTCLLTIQLHRDNPRLKEKPGWFQRRNRNMGSAGIG
jgi:hypothetical protein